MSIDQDLSAHREPDTDFVGLILQLIAPKPTLRLPSEEVRFELRAMVEHRWQDRAACTTAEPTPWPPVKASIPATQVGEVCAACPVNRSCLAVALLWNETGIWAGTHRGQRTHGYRLLRRGVSPATVVELLLTQPNLRRSAGSGLSGRQEAA